MKEETTQRGHIVDAIEVIANEIAFASHCYELISNIDNDIKYSGDKSKLTELIDIQLLLIESIKVRRLYMNKLKDECQWNMDYRCMVKHAIASWWFSIEVYQANEDPFYMDMIIRESEKLSRVLSKFTGIAMTDCLRCLQDSLQEKVLNFNEISWPKLQKNKKS